MKLNISVTIIQHADQSKRLLWLLEELRLPYELRKGGPEKENIASTSSGPTVSSSDTNTGSAEQTTNSSSSQVSIATVSERFSK